jgi:hypothetical protein
MELHRRKRLVILAVVVLAAVALYLCRTYNQGECRAFARELAGATSDKDAWHRANAFVAKINDVRRLHRLLIYCEDVWGYDSIWQRLRHNVPFAGPEYEFTAWEICVWRLGELRTTEAAAELVATHDRVHADGESAEVIEDAMTWLGPEAIPILEKSGHNAAADAIKKGEHFF